MSAVEVTGVYKHSVELVDPGTRLVRILEEFAEVDFEGEFMSIVDLLRM